MAPLQGVHLDTLRLKMVRAVTQATAARPNAEYDLLSLLIALPRARDTDVAIERITLARALGHVPTTEAGRVLFAFSAAFNGTFRQEVGRVIRGQLKDYVLCRRSSRRAACRRCSGSSCASSASRCAG